MKKNLIEFFGILFILIVVVLVYQLFDNRYKNSVHPVPPEQTSTVVQIDNRESSVDNLSNHDLLISRVDNIKNWVRKMCPNRNYLECLKNSGKRVIVNDNAIIVHMSQIFGDVTNPLGANYEDLCVVVWNNTPNSFDVVVTAFNDQNTCNFYVKYDWPGSFGVDSICENSDGGWGHYLRVKYY